MQKQDMAKWVSSMKKGILLSHFQQNFRVKVHQNRPRMDSPQCRQREKKLHTRVFLAKCTQKINKMAANCEDIFGKFARKIT